MTTYVASYNDGRSFEHATYDDAISNHKVDALAPFFQDLAWCQGVLQIWDENTAVGQIVEVA